MLFGLVGIILGAAVLCAVFLVVDRLDQRASAPKRVAWRPWYRTAIGCAYFMAIGFGSNSGRFIGGPVLLEFAGVSGLIVFIGLQLTTQSRIRVQVVEIFSYSFAFMLGILLAESIGFSTRDIAVRHGLREHVILCGGWFLSVTGIAVLSTVLVRIVRKFLSRF